MRTIILITLLATAAASAVVVVALADLVGPCEVTSFDMFCDGGTRGGELRDAEGRVLKFCRDGRMRPVRADEEPPDVEEPWLFHVGAEHPDHDGALPLELGGAEEAALVALLWEWVECEIGGEALAEARDRHDGDPHMPMLAKLVADHGLSEDQERAFRVRAMLRDHERRYGNEEE